MIGASEGPRVSGGLTASLGSTACFTTLANLLPDLHFTEDQIVLDNHARWGKVNTHWSSTGRIPGDRTPALPVEGSDSSWVISFRAMPAFFPNVFLVIRGHNRRLRSPARAFS